MDNFLLAKTIFASMMFYFPLNRWTATVYDNAAGYDHHVIFSFDADCACYLHTKGNKNIVIY